MSIAFLVKCVLVAFLVGVLFHELISGRKLRATIRRGEDSQKKFLEFYYILVQWLRVHSEGRTLADYFKKNDYKTVAIYGMKELGEALLDELTKNGVEVEYGIDRDADNLYVGVDTYKPDEELKEVDVVVVTAVHYYDAIEADLKKKMNSKIISLEDLVWEA